MSELVSLSAPTFFFLFTFLPGFQETIPTRLVALADHARHVLALGRGGAFHVLEPVLHCRLLLLASFERQLVGWAHSEKWPKVIKQSHLGLSIGPV